MNATTLPKEIKAAISSSVGVMLGSVGIPQNRIDGALAALFAELNGESVRALTNPEPLDRVLTRKQAADVCACSTKTITERVKSGKLRAVYGGKAGRRLTGISAASLRAFIEGRAA